MSYPTDRVILFDRAMNPLPELSSSEVFSRMRSEEINSEHELVIVTTRRLEEGWRALTVDGTGKWREWVVTEPDEVHQSGNSAIGTYRFVWSLQYDLTASYAHVDAASIGLGSSMTSQQAAAKVLEGVARWTVGTCDAPDIQDGDGVVLIYESAWSKLSKIVAATGWEVEAEIEVSNLYGVTARKLCLYAHIGSTEATRRFDWGEDVSEIKRTPDPGPYYCRVVPLGKGETEYADDDETTFEWPMDITEETGSPSLYYIEDAEAAAAFRMPDGNGGWWYPTKAVSYDEDDPELLLAAAQDDLLNHTRPNVSYEATVAQFVEAGLDAHGVALGDDIQIVDRGFNPDAALRLQGRVIKIELDELSPESTTVLTIGNLSPNMSSTLIQTLSELTERQSKIAESISSLNTPSYVRSLLDRLNQEINATGGYGYLVEGEGFITYDVAVSNPLVATEASQVVQIKGGAIRIANSKKSGFAGIDDWDWKTVFTSGHITSNLITAAQITAGYIGNITNSNYWNLDTGELVLRMAAPFWAGTSANAQTVTTSHGIVTADEDMYYLLSGWSSANPNRNILGLKIENYDYDPNTQQSTTANGQIIITPSYNLNENNGCWDSIASKQEFHILSHYTGTNRTAFLMGEEKFEIDVGYNAGYHSFSSTPTGIYVDKNSKALFRWGNNNVTMDEDGLTLYSAGVLTLTSMTSNLSAYNKVLLHGIADCGSGITSLSKFEVRSNLTPVRVTRLSVGSSGDTSSSGGYPANGDITCSGIEATGVSRMATLYVDGTKSRRVNTRNYNKRLLFCYETATPYFGDIGSGVLDADGYCYVEIDAVFAETITSNARYQVFLQKCGRGDIWVEEKREQYFVVCGTPNLKFDWEIKSRQIDYASTRLEDCDLFYGESNESAAVAMETESMFDIVDRPENIYNDAIKNTQHLYDDDNVIAQLESIYDEELATA